MKNQHFGEGWTDGWCREPTDRQPSSLRSDHDAVEQAIMMAWTG